MSQSQSYDSLKNLFDKTTIPDIDFEVSIMNRIRETTSPKSKKRRMIIISVCTLLIIFTCAFTATCIFQLNNSNGDAIFTIRSFFDGEEPTGIKEYDEIFERLEPGKAVAVCLKENLLSNPDAVITSYEKPKAVTDFDSIKAQLNDTGKIKIPAYVPEQFTFSKGFVGHEIGKPDRENMIKAALDSNDTILIQEIEVLPQIKHACIEFASDNNSILGISIYVGWGDTLITDELEKSSAQKVSINASEALYIDAKDTKLIWYDSSSDVLYSIKSTNASLKVDAMVKIAENLK